ncbi:adhesin [Dactylosporangium sp. CA-139066]|uniref:adhesin n=1 Tax=Dactylosporangium sp. CA-139066 TaxID=3239930 RepID=UPI003D8D0EBC
MTSTDALGGRWAAAGPSGEDIAYRTQSLRFGGMELALDESVPFRTLFRLWLYAALAAGTVWLFFTLLAFVSLLGGAQTASRTGDTSGLSGSGTLVEVGWFLSFVVFWVVLLLTKLQEPVAEWRTLLEGKAAAADSSYAAIFQSLARRRIPVGVTPRRIRSDVMPEAVNNRLVITERSYVAYVSVFAFGTSLYVGWTMWRSRRGVALVGQFIKDLFGSMLGRTGIINQMLRTERVRAMREAVHSAVREGVDAAVEGINVPIAATFGYEIPIESGAGSAPVTTFVPGPPAQPVGPPTSQYFYPPTGQPVSAPPVSAPPGPTTSWPAGPTTS